MNKIFKIIWNRTLYRHVVVNEATRSIGKASGAGAAAAAAFAAFAAGGVLLSNDALAEDLALGDSASAGVWLSIGRTAEQPLPAGMPALAAAVEDAVSRNGIAIGLDQNGAFGWSDLELPAEALPQDVSGAGKAFNAYQWDEHELVDGMKAQAVDETVHVAKDATFKADDWSGIDAGNHGYKPGESIGADTVFSEDGTITVTTTFNGESTTVTYDNAEDFKSSLLPDYYHGSPETVEYFDEVTGSWRTANVWSDFIVNDDYAGSERFPAQIKSDYYDAEGNRIGRGQYVDKVFFSVEDGSTLTVEVGEGDFKNFNAVLKGTNPGDGINKSAVFEASGESSRIVYNSKTNVQLAQDEDSAGGGNGISHSHEVVRASGHEFDVGTNDFEGLSYYVYKKQKVDEDGRPTGEYETKDLGYLFELRRSENWQDELKALEDDGWFRDESDARSKIFTVRKDHLAEDLKTLSDYLISKLGQKKDEEGSGSYDESWYQTNFRLAIEEGSESWSAEFAQNSEYYLPEGDSTLKPASQQTVSFLHAEEGADLLVTENGAVYLNNSVASVARVDEGSSLVIEDGGVLGVSGGYGWVVNSHGGKVVNRGEIDVSSSDGTSATLGVGIHLQDGASFTNSAKGVVSHGASVYGLAADVSGGSRLVNEGLFNLATRPLFVPDASATPKEETQLVRLSGEENNISTFRSSGVIYFGGKYVEKTELRDDDGSLKPHDELLEVLGKESADPSAQIIYGVDLGNYATFENTGVMATGTSIRNLTMVRVDNANEASDSPSFVNRGSMLLRAGNTDEGIGLNAAVRVNAGSALNDENGTIELTGTNSVGLYAVEEGAFVENKGSIVVGTLGVDYTPNYGIWLENGTEGRNSGSIKLVGNGAIGVHARSGAHVVMEGGEGAGIDFNEEAQNQIGYLIYGQNADGESSLIEDKSTGTKVVDAKNSTYFRVDTGASMSLESGNFAASAEGSSIITVTGAGAEFTAQGSKSGELNFTVGGENADGSAALRVSGGAHAYWLGNIGITAKKGGAIGVISGEYIDVSTNEADPDKWAESWLYNEADVTSKEVESGAYAFIAQAGGTLANQGTIELQSDEQGDSAEFTGVLLEGGKLYNNYADDGEGPRPDDASISVHGVAVEVRGTGSKLHNAGLIEATGGTAAVRLTQGAELSLTESTQGTITAGGSANAVLIESGGQLTVDGAVLSMKEGSKGNVIENRSEKAVSVGAVEMTVRDGIGIHTETLSSTKGEKVITVAGAADGTGVYKTADGTGIAIEHIDADGSATASKQAVTISGDYTIASEEANKGHGTGVRVNTSGSATVNAAIKDVNIGVLVNEAGSLAVGQANVQSAISVSGADAAGIRLEGAALGSLVVNGSIEAASGTAIEAASGTAIDLSTDSTEAVKTIGSVALTGTIKGGEVGLDLSGSVLTSTLTINGNTAISGGTGIDLSGARIGGSISNNGTIESDAQNGTALLLSGAAAAAADGKIAIANAGTIGRAGGTAVDAVLGKEMTSGVSFTNTKTVNGNVRLENAQGSKASHTITLKGGSTITGDAATSAGSDSFVLSGIAAGDQAKVFKNANAGDGWDVLKLEAGSVWTVDSEAEQGRLAGFEQIELTGKSTFTVVDDDYLPELGTFDGTNAQYSIDDGSALSLVAGVDNGASEVFVFTEAVEGAGIINADGKGGKFAFGEKGADTPEARTGEALYTGEHFTGTLNLKNLSATYEWNMAEAFRQADVHLGEKATLTVGEYDLGEDAARWSQMHGLFLENGSTLVYDGSAGISISSSNTENGLVNVFTDSRYKVNLVDHDGESRTGTELALNGGTVSIQIDTESDFQDGNETWHRVVEKPLMAQDEGSDDIRLVVGNEKDFKITGSLENINLELRDSNGNIVEGELTYKLKSLASGNPNAPLWIGDAYYAYGLSTSSYGWEDSEDGKDNGLYVSKQLVRVYLNSESKGNDLLHLNGASSETAVRADEIHAHIYGEGGFYFAGLGNDTKATGYVSNDRNAFLGEVLVKSGKLVSTESNSLGGAVFESDDAEYVYAKDYSGYYASALTIRQNAAFWLGNDEKSSLSQTIGSLDASQNASLVLNSGSLTIDAEASKDGTWFGPKSSYVRGAGVLQGGGNSKLILADGSLDVTGDQNGFAGTAELRDSTETTINAGAGLGTNTIDMKGSASLDVNLQAAEGSLTLAAAAKSDGSDSLIYVKGSDGIASLQKFAFRKDQKDKAFKGTLKLSNVGYDWNKDLLSSARLTSEAGSVVDVDGVRSVRALDIGDGTNFNFGELALGKFLNDNAIKVTGGGSGSGNESDLTLPGTDESADFVVSAQKGTASGGKLNYQQDKDTLQGGVYSVLDLDDGAHFTALVDQKFGSETLDGSIRLVGEDGEAVSSVEVGLTQNGTAIADATFGFVNNGAAGGMGEVTISNGDLGVNYQLTALDIEDGQSVFVATTMETDTDNTLTARISEEEDSTKGGGLVFGKASDGASNEATIKNSDNRLTGAVELLEGMTLNVAASDSLGSDDTHTRKVALGKGAVLRLGSDSNSVTQTVGAIAGGANDSTSTVDLAASSKLTIDGQTDSVFGILKGGKLKGGKTASITLEAGDLTILSADEDHLFDGEAFIGSTEGKTASLTVKKHHGLGTANVQIGANDKFVVDAEGNDTLLNSMTGQGSVHFTGAGKTTLTEASVFTGGLYVEKGAVEAADAAADAGGVLAGAMLGKGDLHLTGGSLTVNSSADWDLESHGHLLTGSGTLNVVHEGDHQDDFTFAAGQTAQADPLFTGTLDLSNITIGFSGNTNKSVLRKATLVVNKDAQATFNEKGVTFKTLGVKENGILDFSSMEAKIGTTTAENAVHADAFDFSGASGAKVRVDMADAFLNEIPESEDPVEAASLLDQDNGEILLRLGVLNAEATEAVDVGGLGLEIKNGDTFEDASKAPYSLTVDITQSTADGSDETVADGFYNLGLTGDRTGWGVAHQLVEVRIHDGKTLDLSAGKSDSTLSAKVTETGNASGGGSINVLESIYITNGANSFSGDVSIGERATLTIASGALGGLAEGTEHADRAVLASGSKLVFGLDEKPSADQTIGSIRSAAGSTLDLRVAGHLTLDTTYASEEDGSIISGLIKGGKES